MNKARQVIRKMEGNRIRSRLLMGAAVFLLCAGAFFLARQLLSRRYPEKVYTDYSSFEREGLRYYRRKGQGVFRSRRRESHLYIDGEGDPIRAIEFDVEHLTRKHRYHDYVMEVYFDTGAGFNEYECIKSQLQKGRVRIDFDADVQRVRVDFFSHRKCRVRLSQIILNPSGLENGPLFLGVSIISLLCLVLMTAKAGVLSFAGSVFFWLVTELALGIPFVRDARGTLLLPYMVFTALSIFLFGTLLLKEGKRKEVLFTAALCVMAFTLYMYWAAITPYAEGPDEAMRHDVVYFIAERGVLPKGYDPAVRNLIWGFSYAYYPILPYILGGYLEFLALKLGDPNWMQLVMLARMVNVICGTVSVYFAARLSFLLLPKKRARFVLPLFIAFLPELAFINTYVNNDSMAIMSTSMILFFWARGCESDWEKRDALGLAISMGICALTYYNCYGFILVSIPFFFYTVSQGKKSRGEIARLTAFIVAVTFAVCGWWFIRNAVLYDGDLLGRSTLNAYAEIYAQEGYKPSQLTNPRKEGETLTGMLFGRQWISMTLRSFVAMFSTYSLRAKHIVYTLYKLYLGTGIAGAAAAFLHFLFSRKRKRTASLHEGSGKETELYVNEDREMAASLHEGSGKEAALHDNEDGEMAASLHTDFRGAGDAARKDRNKAAFYFMALLALVIVLGLAVYYSYAVDFQPQGRYILPCVLPLGCLLAAGFSYLAELAGPAVKRLSAGKASEAAAERIVSALCCAFPPAMMIFVLLDTVVRYYIR